MRALAIAVIGSALLSDVSAAQPGIEQEVLGAVAVHMSLGSKRAVIVAPLASCVDNGTLLASDCVGRELSPSGHARAKAAAARFAAVSRGTITSNPLEAVRAMQSPNVVKARPRVCNVAQPLVLIFPGPVKEMEAGARWITSVTYFTYPLQSECEGDGFVVEYHLERKEGTVRIRETHLKKHYSGVHLPPRQR